LELARFLGERGVILVAGLSDAAVETMFITARDDDYAALAQEARDLQRSLSRRKRQGSDSGQSSSALLRLHKRLSEVVAIDFFGAFGRGTVEGLLASIDAALRPPAGAPGEPRAKAAQTPGGVWVTRTGVHVDRIASAWLIRRFIDPEAKFKFVRGHDYAPEPGEIRFDMYEAEFTHEGELCTFEVLLQRFGIEDSALVRVGELVHDIDLKDGKFGHAETSGLDHLVAGIAMRHKDDEARLSDGAAVLEALYEYFRRKKP